MRGSSLGRRDHLAIVRRHRHARDVFLDGAVKQLHPLWQITDVLAQNIRIILIQCGPIEPDFTARRVPNTR